MLILLIKSIHRLLTILLIDNPFESETKSINEIDTRIPFPEEFVKRLREEST